MWTMATSMPLQKLLAPKFEVEKFDGKANFNVWIREVTNMLVQQGLHKTITRIKPSIKPSNVVDKELEYMSLQACSMIELFLANNILKNILGMDRNAKNIWDMMTQLYLDNTMTLSNDYSDL